MERPGIEEVMKSGQSFIFVGSLRELLDIAERVGVRVYESLEQENRLGTGYCIVSDEKQLKTERTILLTDVPPKDPEYPIFGTIPTKVNVWNLISRFVMGHLSAKDLREWTRIPKKNLEAMVLNEALERLTGKDLLLFLDRLSRGGLDGVWITR